MDLSLLAVVGVLCIVGVHTLAPKVGLPTPLLLVALGITFSVLSPAPLVTVKPEWILAGVLPPLLYSASVSMPAMNFRRDFRAISALSVTLVVLSSVALGLLFRWQLPELGLAGGIALGAVLSPTDAVATSIVKRLGVARRAVAVLEGESMLNDATALVILRSAVAGSAVVSLWRIGGQFVLSVLIAAAIGVVVGSLALWVRRWIPGATANTLLSFVVPFLAFEPTEHFGASGLVAVVAAGLVIGQGAPRHLGPVHRLNDETNWRTVELLLEGAMFLLMGLEVLPLLRDVREGGDSVALAITLAAIALAVTLLVRALFVGPLLWGVHKSARRYEGARQRLSDVEARLAKLAARDERGRGFLARVRTRVRRVLADADYVTSRPLRFRDGALIVWAGMRGAVTLAAAHTLPLTMPHRSLLILIAFLVAAGSLALQASTLPWLIRLLRFPGPNHEEQERERAELERLTEQAASECLAREALRRADGSPFDPTTLEAARGRVENRDRRAESEGDAQLTELLRIVLDVQRKSLLQVRDDGVFSSEALGSALAQLDALQIGLQLRAPRGGHEG